MRTTTINFSPRERKDLLVSWAIVSLVFAIAFGGLTSAFFPTLIIASITAGLGFLLHELAHKVVAIHYGCSAEYRGNTTMLGLALVIALVFKAIFIAPGAVMVRGVQSKKENGIISAAGPVTNIVLALVFGAVGLASSGLLQTAAILGYMINAWLALFNMIPVLPFDGSKVWVWSKPIYITIATICVLLVFGGYFPW